jgi:8-oxo-dGTP pyrophosphatase MutT (NUDIX family)
MEIWDLYDVNDERTGETWERIPGNYNKIPDGRYHMVCDILVQHTDGTYLLTKRHPEKDVYPGFWEASAGGSALSGESPIDCAKRELFEETGIKADEFIFISHTRREMSHSMFYSYLVITDCPKDSIVLQEGETTDYRWVDAKGLLDYAESADAMRNHVERYRGFINELKDETGYDQ